MNYQSLRIAAVTAAVFLLAGCGADKSREDSHDLTQSCRSQTDGAACIDKTPKRVIAFHNSFPNVATACDGYGHRIYVTTRTAGNQVTVVPDPSCHR